MYFSVHANVFSTQTCHSASKGEFWRNTVSDLFTPLAPRFDNEDDFEGSVCHEKWDNISLSEVSAGPQIVTHGSREISLTSSDNIFFIIHLEGDAAVEVDSRSPDLRVREGDLIAITTAQPYRLKFSSEFRQLVISVPVGSLDSKWQAVNVRELGKLAHLGCDVMRYLQAVTHRDSYQIDESEFRKDHLLDFLWILLTASIQMPERAAVSRGERFAAIERHIAAEFRNPELNPESAANALGISLRTLYKAFQQTPTTFQALLLEHRLKAAQYLLSTDGVCGRAISDIAFEVGFSDLSHFNRRFKQRFEQTPREYIRHRCN